MFIYQQNSNKTLQYFRQYMYGRTNIFSRDTPTTTTPPSHNYPSTHPTNNNAPINQNRPMNSDQNIGSNRLNYIFDDFPSGIKDAVTQWKEITPMSIVCRPETLHLSSTQFRLQDYYLIRSKQIRPHNEQRLTDSIKFGSFSQQLMRIEPRAPFNYSSERCIDLDVIRSGKGNMSSTPTFSSTNTPNNGGTSSNSNNMFSRGQSSSSSNNIFTNNQNSTNTNIFSSNRNTPAANSTSGNMFNSRNTTGGNVFANGSSGTASNQHGGNNNSQNSSNSNNQGSNQGSTSGNIFTNNSSNNNTNSSNAFNANRGNNSQSTGNNIFSNNNPANNSNSNNMFSNNQNSQNNQNNNTGSTSNNLFKPTSQTSNNPPNVDLNLMMHALQNYIQTNQLYMQQIIQQNQSKQKQKDERPEEVPDIWHQVRHKSHSNSYFQQFQEDQIRFNQSRKRKEEDCLILMPRQPKEIKRNNYKTQFQHQEQNLSYNYFTSSANRPPNNQFLPTNSVLYQQEPKNNKSLRLTSHMPNKSIRLSNHPKDQFNSMIYSRCDKTIYQTKARQNKIVFDGPCKCTLILDIFWEESNNNSHGSKKVKINSPIHKKDQIELYSIDLQSQKGRKDFERELRQKSKFIRSDAKFTPDRQKCQIDHANSRIKVVGKVQQKILNISNYEYEVYYSRVAEGHIYDLTISKVDVGTVVWDEPVQFQTLDFCKGQEFYIEDCEVNCEIEELKGPCRVTFNTLPLEIKKVMEQKGYLQARCNLQKMLKKQSSGIQFSELWESGNWSFRLKNGFTNDV